MKIKNVNHLVAGMINLWYQLYVPFPLKKISFFMWLLFKSFLLSILFEGFDVNMELA